jgi:hypothetical protein
MEDVAKKNAEIVKKRAINFPDDKIPFGSMVRAKTAYNWN